MRIVYIGGWMRSGTTLLCEMVGAFEGALALGELSGIWRAAHRNEPCSCGAAIPSCQVWGPALAAVERAHGISRQDYQGLAKQAQDVLRTRSAHRLARLDPDDRSGWPESVRSYVEILHTLLASISETTGAQILVDSSKLPPGFLLERLMPGTSVDLVHIVRDPRAVANSERKTRVRSGPDADLLPPGRSAVRSVFYWSAFNLAVRAYSRYADSYIKVDYSRLTSCTDIELDRVAGLLGVRRKPDVVLDGGHVAVGNPARFDGSTRTVRADDSWKHELRRREKLWVSSASLPTRMLLR